MAVDFSGTNDSCLSAFGQEFSFMRQDSAVAETIVGILEAGAELEEQAPLDGSTYARLWVAARAISPAPQKGDEISSATNVYKIIQLQEDAGGGLWLLLRLDRPVI